MEIIEGMAKGPKERGLATHRVSWPRGLVLGTLVVTVLPQARLALGQALSTAARLEQEMAACRAEKAKLRAEMAAAFADFDAAPAPTPLEVLVSLDGRIRDLLRTRPSYRPCARDRELIYDPHWQRMGVRTDYWDDLAYSGQMLVEAHRGNPQSSLRPYTLFATVFGETPAHGLGVMPDISAAYAYESEFPAGPFVRDVYRTIAGFHKDLFMVLRDRLSDFDETTRGVVTAWSFCAD